MRRWRRAVLVLQAIALLVYLVMPDPFTSSASAAASPAVGAQAGQAFLSHLSRDDPARPMTTSDEVATAPRDTPGAHPPAADALCLASTALPDPDRARPSGEWAPKGSALVALRPSLSALQVLRC
ncbi:hypothetical protein [Streptosporangium sp. NPDC001681]|uniref:hypothetical protein n=1 Tax=Streptosporangium sp. NPDC001681 TaxID=3154395 RepID=UPI00331BFE02